MDPIITSKRLIMRHVGCDDVDDIQRCILDSHIYEMVARIPPNKPRNATQDWISTHAEARIAKTDFVYAITLEQKFIGIIGLHRPTTRDLFELGYWMCPTAWRKGYATEAGKAVLLNLDRSLGPQKTRSGYFADNLASGRVLEKLGYIQTGLEQAHCVGRNKTLPHVMLERAAS